MPATARPRRSVLYMPGSNLRALEKARSIPADALIFDLEDAVAPAKKPAARDTVCAVLAEGGYGGRERIVRINGLDTEWGGSDIEAVAGAGPDAILVPKVNAPGDVTRAVAALKKAGADETVALWVMMETAAGMLHAADIACADTRLACFVMGTNDLVKELHASHTPERLPVLASLSFCLLAARSAGLACIDGVHNAIRDEEGLRMACRQGRKMGFDGKTLIHPSQVPACNEIFAPSEEDLAIAARQVEAFEEATREGRAVAVIDGRIVEKLHAENARRMLAEAEQIRALAAES